MSIKTKRILLYSMYGVICLTFLLSLLFVNKFIKPNDEKATPVSNIELKPITNIVDDNTMTVFEDTSKITMPYIDNDVKVGLSYYEYKSEKENQENSLIYYEGTYMPSTGIFYTKEDKFPVTSVYGGKVLEITKNDLLGNVIKIDHTNNLIGVYQCIDDIKVNVGDDIMSGSILGYSSTCNVFASKGNGIYLELIHNGKNINPEYYYGKTIEEIE